MLAIVGSDGYRAAFQNKHYTPLFNTAQSILEKNVKIYDAVVFTGGTDVDPSVYGDGAHDHTSSPDKERDKYEAKLFHECVEKGVKMIGICRGAQFLCAMSGGKLIQDVTNHTNSHSIKTIDGDTIYVSSTHHQMMHPYTAPDHLVIAWAEGLSDHYQTGGLEFKLRMKTSEKGSVVIEPEVVLFPHTKALCVQYHPEMMNQAQRGWIYFNQLVENFLNE